MPYLIINVLKISILCFTVVELTLFLDTHPDNQEAMRHFDYYNRLKKEKYEEQKGRALLGLCAGGFNGLLNYLIIFLVGVMSSSLVFPIFSGISLITTAIAGYVFFKEKLKRWTTEYNNFPMKPLNWLSPNEKLAEFLA